jgi:hypothetical protein
MVKRQDDEQELFDKRIVDFANSLADLVLDKSLVRDGKHKGQHHLDPSWILPGIELFVARLIARMTSGLTPEEREKLLRDHLDCLSEICHIEFDRLPCASSPKTKPLPPDRRFRGLRS